MLKALFFFFGKTKGGRGGLNFQCRLLWIAFLIVPQVIMDLRSRGSVPEKLRRHLGSHPEMLERVSQNESFKVHMETVRKHVGTGLERGRPKNIAVICLDCSGMKEGMAFSELLYAAVRCKPPKPSGSFVCSPTAAVKHVEPFDSWGGFRTCGSTKGPCHKCMGTGVTKEKGGLTAQEFFMKAKAFTLAIEAWREVTFD